MKASGSYKLPGNVRFFKEDAATSSTRSSVLLGINLSYFVVMMVAPGRAAATVPSGSRAQHNLLSFPGGDRAARKTVLLAFATIATELGTTLESRGGGSGGPARRARRLWPYGPGAPRMPAPALAGEARAASSPPSPFRCPLPLAPPRSPGRARVGAADRLGNHGESCSPSPQLLGGRRGHTLPLYSFLGQTLGSGAAVPAALGAVDGK
ncbi:uncharacterized protein LOC119088251 [Peromyscus leucopus]|uniref:uncharacterized protein LOC119088251 n=1 Tax=Peromyscus leucopus TaxID=10041 RepID=UPI0018853132|nr:uncharacterized protein LOC119088251 [Peromyscus leucopus]